LKVNRLGLRGSPRSTVSRSDPSGTCLDKLPRGTRSRLRPMEQCLNRTFSSLRPQPHSRSPRSLCAAPSHICHRQSLQWPHSGSLLSPLRRGRDLPVPERRLTPRPWKSLRSRATSAPEASLKLDAIESGYAVPLTRLNLHVWCIDLSIRPRRSAPRAREVAEQAQSIEREQFKKPTSPLLWAREAASRATPLLSGSEVSPRTSSRRGGTEAKG